MIFLMPYLAALATLFVLVLAGPWLAVKHRRVLARTAADPAVASRAATLVTSAVLVGAVAYGLLMIYLGDAGSSLADGDAPDDALAWMALRRRVTAGVPAAVVALTALLGWASRRRPVVFLLSVTSPVLLVALSFITNSLWTAANPPP